MYSNRFSKHVTLINFEFSFTVTPLLHTCIQAHRRGLSYPRYVWIIHGKYPDQWWNMSQQIHENQTEICSYDEVADFLNGIISIQSYPTVDNRSEVTASGVVSCNGTIRMMRGFRGPKLSSQIASLSSIAHSIIDRSTYVCEVHCSLG